MQKIKTKIIYPIFLPHLGCPFLCIYCNQQAIANVSNTFSNSGEDLEQSICYVKEHLQMGQIQNFINKHKEKFKEVAIYGGTFSSLNLDQISSVLTFIASVFDDKTFFRISTRPDFINHKILLLLKSLRVNTIELGIQSFSDVVLKESLRGYTSEQAKNSCTLVLEHGFNLSIQLLVGLPKESEESIETNIKELLKIKPDFVRLYPLLVLKDTELEVLYRRGKYKPLTVDEAVRICSLYLQICEANNVKVIKMGLHADIESDSLVAGPYHARFGELVRQHNNTFPTVNMEC